MTTREKIMGNTCGTGSSGPRIPTVTADDVKTGLGKNSIMLIDVRNANERTNPGRIPGSLHVPLGEVANAFGPMTEQDFVAEYDFQRPPKSRGEKLVVLSCLAGARASKAAETLSNLGYENLAVYSGSFKDWQAKGNKVLAGSRDEAIVNFDQVKAGLEDQSMLVIDVRNPAERKSPGAIPGTQNVPLSEIWSAFAEMTPEEFETKYGFPRPGPEGSSRMVLHCLKGKRALDAADKLSLLGYDHTKVYKGSFFEWKEKGGDVVTE